MVAVPLPTPVTTPLVASTVAILVLLLLQDPPDTVEVRVEVSPTQIDWPPDNVPGSEQALYVKLSEEVAVAI
jgi:hypothetical protein